MTNLLSATLLLAAPGLVAAADTVTFHKHVEPILQRSCQSCHRPGQIGPMPLLTYTQARPWAKAIKAAVVTGKMPPWFADAPKGHFQNDWRLTDEEKKQMIAWADGGAPAGSPADAPKPRVFADDWSIGKPDLIVEMPEPFSVPAQGAVDYQWVVLPWGLPEDRWITAYEVQPGNRSVVHHVIAFLRPPGSKWLADAPPGVPVSKTKQEGEGGQASGQIAGFVPGLSAEIYPEGYAMKLPAGSDIVLQLHYTTNGKAAQDRTRVGFRLTKEPPRMQVVNFNTSTAGFVIPPGVDNHRVTAERTANHEMELLGLIPHMHLRGKTMNVFLRDADGTQRELLRVPKWDFNWQLQYSPSARTMLKPGQKIFVEAFYDNSPNNPHNPDPTKEVTWGDQTWDEMMTCAVLAARPYVPSLAPGGSSNPSAPTPAKAGR